jgi:hypothetical protein
LKGLVSASREIFFFFKKGNKAPDNVKK